MKFPDWEPHELDERVILMVSVGETNQLHNVRTLGKTSLVFARLGVRRQ